MLVVSTTAGLGTPAQDGTQAILRVGSAPQQQVILTWNSAQGAWVSRPEFTCRMVDQIPMSPTTSGYLQEITPDNIPPQLNDKGVGFQLEPVPDAKLFWDAGLRLQEKLVGEFMWDGVSTPSAYINWYEFDVGTQFLSPVPTNPGVVMTDTGVQNISYFKSTGWQNSPVAAPTHTTWYPELYGTNIARLARFSAQRRWVYGTTSGGISSDGSSKAPPTRAFLQYWFEAEDIPQTTGTSVSLWRDQSGVANNFVQATGASQPTLTRSAVNGKAVVTFDGTDDYMTAPGGANNQPLSVYIVMRQRAGGTDPQVWLDGNATSFLWYRGNSTNQVNFYMGGTADLIYTRGSSWPSPYIAFNGVFNGNATTIWENKTLVATGGGGLPGTNGAASGFYLGARHDAALQSRIDVAEVLVYLTGHDTTTRNSIVDYLNAKYNLF